MISLEEHNKNFVWHLYGTPVKNGIACPECGEELFDSDPYCMLTSCPPKYRVNCDECGYIGYRS